MVKYELRTQMTITERTKTLSVEKKDRCKDVALSWAAPKERETSGQERWQGTQALVDKADNLNWIPRFNMVEGKKWLPQGNLWARQECHGPTVHCGAHLLPCTKPTTQQNGLEKKKLEGVDVNAERTFYRDSPATEHTAP